MSTDSRIVVVNAGLANANGTAALQVKYPDRFFNVGVQEANMASFAAGMATYGYIPFIVTFAPFATRRIADQLMVSIAYAGTNVKIIGGVPQGNLPGLLSQCDLFVLPSLADGFGLVVLQAMACELPVIVSDRTGAAEAVAGEAYSGIVAASDAEALATSIEYFYRLRTERAELGRLARQHVLERHTWPHHAARLLAAIQQYAPSILPLRLGDHRSVLAG